ncbi:hypothetical protein SAMN05421805_113174 [Saccharopolyspora antimicrobica]|uniref:Uncharacterized protein n=1 Tax=Saccharopolyspora antimicrobica TaxID=455193 RepID=A0A1I5GTK5_9PSEU|nr:hypothetical protein [Saccharopolyspora antimicrobica]RKT87367.1 hypothetical protein ATL45_5780 [Saccharopolyspora antimicrobica]SFO39166.1 hypothetical protein SAMN05421805_113174 [Saccharopolyspora antimicrobica]
MWLVFFLIAALARFTGWPRLFGSQLTCTVPALPGPYDQRPLSGGSDAVALVISVVLVGVAAALSLFTPATRATAVEPVPVD